MAEKKAKRRLLFGVLGMVLAVFVTLLFLELGVRAVEHFGSRKTKKERLAEMLKQARSLYPPSNKLFAKVLERERLGLRNYPSMGISLRDYDYPVEKPENTYRIIGLGDSFAWGFGVADNRRTAFKYLECWLNAGQEGRHFEVINCAQPARTVRHYEAYVKEYGKKFDPDMFLILYNLNDSYLPHASMVVERRAENLMEEEKDRLSDISRLYRFVKKRIVKKNVHDYTVAYINEGYFGPEKEQKWGRAQQNIKGIQKFCAENGIELVVAIFPLLFELEKTYPFREEVEEIDSFLRSNRIPSVNLLPAFKGKKTHFLWSGLTDSHPNRTAHRLAAEAIFRFLQQQILSSEFGDVP